MVKQVQVCTTSTSQVPYHRTCRTIPTPHLTHLITGKTHTMGILSKITKQSRNVGLIPRALSHVFGALCAGNSTTRKSWSVSMSFVQVYLENVHDLFASADLVPSGATSDAGDSVASAPARPLWKDVRHAKPGHARSSHGHTLAAAADENLPVREVPGQGFVVEGARVLHAKTYAYVMSSTVHSCSCANGHLTTQLPPASSSSQRSH